MLNRNIFLYCKIITLFRLLAGAILFLVLSSFSAQSQQTRSLQQDPKTNCSFTDPPALDEERFFNLISLERQFDTLRELRARVTDLLPVQKARTDDAKSALEKLRADRRSFDDRPQSGEQEFLSVRLELIGSEIAANQKRLDAASDEERSKITAELQKLQSEQEFVRRRIAALDASRSQALSRLSTLPAEIQNAEQTLEKESNCHSYLQNLNTRVEQKTVGLLIPASQKSNFRLWLSLIYAGIVLVLIGGFYGLAFKDREMRGTIFAQQSGIQFITLFSLVIAIILFGVLEILGDKELAALLGGISGFILGKATTDRLPGGGVPGSLRNVTGNTIAFSSPDTITDSGGRFGVFSVGERVEVSGSTSNNGVYNVAAVSAGSLQTREKSLQNEGAGGNVKVSAVT